MTKTLGGPTGWVTPFIVQNIGTSNTTLELSFYEFTTGRLVTCRKVTGLAPNTSFADVPNNDLDLPHDSAFSVVVRSFGADAVAVVNEHQGSGARAESLSYVGLTSGSDRVHLPYVPKSVAGWLTTFVVQNLGSVRATVSASFVSTDGLKRATLTRSIEPGRASPINPLAEPTLIAGTEYAVTVTSTQPIGVVANAHNDAPEVPAPMAFSYNGTGSETSALYLPYVAKNAAGRSSRIVMQNTGTTDAIPTLRLTSRTGVPFTNSATAPVLPGRTWSPDLRGLVDGEHSAVVEGAGFSALVITTDAASAFGYTAQRPSPSRIFLPNVTRRLGGASGWSTPLLLQSAGTTTVHLRWYRFSDGKLVHTQSLTGLTSGAGVRVDPETVTALADDTQYAVVVDAPAPVAAIVLEFARTGGDSAMAYEGFASASTALPLPSSIVIAPTSAIVERGQTQQFNAAVRDQFTTLLSGPPLTWSVVPVSLGTITNSGSFTAGQVGGTGMVTAVSGSVSATASITVRVPTTTTIGGIAFTLRATATSDVHTESTITSVDAVTIAATADLAVGYIEREFGRAFSQRPAIYAFKDGASLMAGWSSVLGGGNSQPRLVNGVYMPATKKVGLNWGSIKLNLPYSTTRHELVHMMEAQMTGSQRSRPDWFIEGLARLHDLTEPGGQYRAMMSKYRVASMAMTGTLFATSLTSVEWGAMTNLQASAAYFEGAETVRLMQRDLGVTAFRRLLELMGSGQSFGEAYSSVAGRTIDSFLATRTDRLRTLAPPGPGVATAPDTFVGPGLTYMFYGFAPGTTLTETVTVAGYQPSVRTVQADAHGTFVSYLDSQWPAGSYTLTARSGSAFATTAVIKPAGIASGASGVLSMDGPALPSHGPALRASLPE